MLTRRKFVSSAGVAAAGVLSYPARILPAMPKVATELGKVKIRDVKTAVIDIKYKTTLVKVTTDSGLYGLGEAFPKAEVTDLIDVYKEFIIGEDPLQVEYLYEKLVNEGIKHGSRTGVLSGAIAGIEIALWDLAGKILNVPVYVLLGGKYRDKLLVYHDTGSPNSIDPKAWVDEALKSKEYGFRAMKFSLKRFTDEKWKWNRALSIEDIKLWIKILEAVKLALGDDFSVGVDLHWRYNTRDAMEFVQMAEDLNLWFLEDPMPPENADAFARLTTASKIPIATGENLYARQSFRPFIEKQACDILNPDPQKCGGLLETKKIADWADLYYINMICHNMCTPVGTIASGHACTSIKSFLALESDSVELPYWQDIIQRDRPIFNNGFLEILNKPGLGVLLNEDVCKAHLVEGSNFFE